MIVEEMIIIENTKKYRRHEMIVEEMIVEEMITIDNTKKCRSMK